MTKEQLRMQMLAGIITEGQYKNMLNENNTLPDWIKGDELDFSEAILYVKEDWFNKNKQALEKNIKEFKMLYSRSKGIFLKTMDGYNPKEDYITDGGSTIINGKPAGINSSDKLESRQKAGNDLWSSIENDKQFIDLNDPKDLNFLTNIVPPEEIKNIKEYLKNKYKKNNFTASPSQSILIFKKPFNS
jgi:hypothetical protein